jgi:hypothetical protein
MYYVPNIADCIWFLSGCSEANRGLFDSICFCSSGMLIFNQTYFIPILIVKDVPGVFILVTVA